jgi:hypothetical protein
MAWPPGRPPPTKAPFFFLQYTQAATAFSSREISDFSILLSCAAFSAYFSNPLDIKVEMGLFLSFSIKILFGSGKSTDCVCAKYRLLSI